MKSERKNLARPVVRKLFESPEPHILDYLTVLAKYKVSIVASTLGLGVLFVAFTFAMPYSFISTSTILPPSERDDQNILGFLAKAASSLSIMKKQENASIDVFRNVMESRLFAEAVLKDSAIRAYYKSFGETEEEHQSALLESLTPLGRKDGVMEIQAEVKTHWLASSAEKATAQELTAHLANTFVSTLDQLNKARLNQLGALTKEYVGKAYASALREQDSVDQAYAAFQKTNGVADLPAQVGAMIANVAALESSAQQSQIQYNIFSQEFTGNHPIAAELQQKLAAAKLAVAGYKSGAGLAYSVSLAALPKLAQQTAEFERRLKLGDNVINYLRLQLEQAKIDEVRSDPTLTVIDVAPRPLRKAAPHRLSMLLLGLTVGLVGSVAVTMFRESIAFIRLESERMSLLKSYLRFSRRDLPEFDHDLHESGA